MSSNAVSSDAVPSNAVPSNAAIPVRVAACQLSLQVGELDANRAAAAAAITEAASQGAQIVIVPELTPSGYVFATIEEARSLSEPADGQTAQQWTGLAAEHDLVIIGGFAELAVSAADPGGTLYNSSMLVDATGVRAVYRKAHLWDAEADFFVPGDQPPPVIDTKYGRLSMMICYDVEFPEWVRIPALAGADLLAVPTNWPADLTPAGERPMVTFNVQTAAFANRMFVAAACRCGDERGVRWVGGSLIADVTGYPLAGPASLDRLTDAAERATAEILIADCDLAQARAKATGPRNDAHADRRADLY